MAKINSLQSIIIVLVIIGIVIGIGLLVLQEFANTMGTDAGSVGNETINMTNTSCTYVANNFSTGGINCWNSFSVGRATNISSGVLITAGNYTVNPSGCLQSIANGDGDYAVDGWNISYTFQYGNSTGCEGMDETISATATIPTWLTLIVLVLIVGVIMYLVFVAVPKLGVGQVTGAEGTIAEI